MCLDSWKPEERYQRYRRGTVQVAQHDYRLARLPVHAKNRVHSRSAATVAVGPRLVRPPDMESEAVVARLELRMRGLGECLELVQLFCREEFRQLIRDLDIVKIREWEMGVPSDTDLGE